MSSNPNQWGNNQAVDGFDQWSDYSGGNATAKWDSLASQQPFNGGNMNRPNTKPQSLADVSFASEQAPPSNASIYQDQIIAAFCWPVGDFRYPNTDFLTWSAGVNFGNISGVDQRPVYRNQVLDWIRNRVIQGSHEDYLVEAVQLPPNENGQVLNDIKAIDYQRSDGKKSKRELRMIGYTVDGKEGYDLYQVDQSSGQRIPRKDDYYNNAINKIREEYPLPQRFLGNIQSNLLPKLVPHDNVDSQQKRQEYLMAAHDLAHRIYGSRYDYFMAFEQLKKEAFGGQQSSKTGESGYNHEWLPGRSASCQISYAQAANGFNPRLANRLLPDGKCEEEQLIQGKDGFYGVFSGFSSTLGLGKIAARRANEVVSGYCNIYKHSQINGGNLAWMLNAASACVYNDRQNSYSTGSLVKITNLDDAYEREQNGNYSRLSYASIGDTRICVVKPDGRVFRITQDERTPDGRITNALGFQPPQQGFSCIMQYGDILVSKGDRVVLCSNGITYGMDDNRIAAIVNNSNGPEDAANNLVGSASKIDDRTAIVVVV